MEQDSWPHIRIISEKFVKPNHEVEASKQAHYLNLIDLAFLSLDQMQKGLLFPTKPNNIQTHLLDKLQKSLSLSLVHYYPLAGRFSTKTFPDEHAMWVYVDCINGDGARLLHATVDVTVHDIISSVDVPAIVPSFFDLGERAVNHDGHTRPLFSIQVTELVDGVFIGFTMNHSVADGTNLWNFISTLSEIFSQLEKFGENEEDGMVSISRKPVYEPFVFDGCGPMFKLPYLDPSEFVVRFDPGPLRERIFHFSSDSLSSLKAKANELASPNNEKKISSFQALAGLLWLSVTRSRNLGRDETTACSLTVSTRARLNPPVSEDHFGNYLAPAQGTCKVGELTDNNLGWAASVVHKIVAGQDEDAARRFVGALAKSPFVAHTGSTGAGYGSNTVLIAGSARFDMYGPEFGLGKAVAVLAGYANKDDGKVTVNPGREGGGSVDLEVCLRPETMHALELDQEFMSFVSN